jgi:hypothetical protein
MVKRRGFKILWPRNIEPPPPYTIRVGFRILWLQNIDLLSVFIVRRRGVQNIMTAKY